VAAPVRTPARSRKAASTTKDRRRMLILGFAILCVICGGGLFALVTRPPAAEPTMAVRPDLDFRTAKIMDDSGDGCSQKTLNNQTWQVTESKQPCDPILRDANGVPVPVGTIHRLDAINKSFMGK
jgi:hypothetical protein